MTRLFIPCPAPAEDFYDGKVHAHELAPYCSEYSSLYRPRRKSKRRQKYFPERTTLFYIVVPLLSLCRVSINVSGPFFVRYSTDFPPFFSRASFLTLAVCYFSLKSSPISRYRKSRFFFADPSLPPR